MNPGSDPLSARRADRRATALPLFLSLCLFLGGSACTSLFGATPPPGEEHMSYLDNGTIRVGVNLNLGGSITFLADAEKRINVVNSHDLGRQIQMSFYSGPSPYHPGGRKSGNKMWKNFPWNPIQSGDWRGNRSRIVEHANDGETIYVKCIPMIWPLENEPAECTFESWLTIKDNTVHVRSRINNARKDTKQYGPHAQEIPAVYTNGPFYRILTYTGNKPFTHDKLTLRPAVFLWKQHEATENWTSLVNTDDWGLGIWHPGAYHVKAGFAGKTGQGGPKDPPTGYIAPLHIDILDHNIQYEYHYVLILGTVTQIRRYVYDHAPRPAAPRYLFARDRQHWVFAGAVDGGWPIQGELTLRVQTPKPLLQGPRGFWPASAGGTLYIRAAVTSKATTARISWRTHAKPSYAAERSIAFPITPDGAFHTYAIHLAASPHYKGSITGLRLAPLLNAAKGDTIRIQWISFREEGNQ